MSFFMCMHAGFRTAYFCLSIFIRFFFTGTISRDSRVSGFLDRIRAEIRRI